MLAVFPDSTTYRIFNMLYLLTTCEKTVRGGARIGFYCMKLLRFISEIVSVVNNVYMYQILITFVIVFHSGFSSSGSGSQGQCSDGQCVLGAYCNGMVA